MRRTALIALAAALSFSAMTAAPAAAADTHTYSRTIAFDDLDLTSEAGARAMLIRIDRAAGAVCGENSGPMTLRARSEARACVRSTSMQVVDALNAPAVSAMFYGHEPMVVVASR